MGYRKSYWVKALLFTISISLSLGVLIAGCGLLDSTNEPAIPDPATASDYHVYYHYYEDNINDPLNVHTPIFSTASFEPVDTIINKSSTNLGDLKFTSDGKFVILSQNFTSTGIIRMSVVDYATGDTVNYVDGLLNYLLRISPDDKYLLTFSSLGPQEIYTIPDLNLVWKDTIVKASGMEFLNEPGKFLRTIFNDTFYVVNFLSNPPVTEKYFANVKDESFGLKNWGFGIDYANGLVYSTGYSDSLQKRILDVRKQEDFSIVDQIETPTWYKISSSSISKSGNLVFLYRTCTSPTGILLYNPQTRTVSNFLDETQVSGMPFYPEHLTITPDEKMIVFANSYGCTGPIGSNPSGDPVFIDILNKEIITVSDPNQHGGQPRFIRIYPIEQ